ncbi:Alkanesulfonates ABC transporter ATP-binding protein / Sulfonate ABC transporter [Collimonas arenae]|uniref:Alkanesulfonates ABC transporter ATP-binding protein / Sulfonate ABC transporter n=1 Tax=Collimonas arenae TaxID=279058 RepID=A0A0A1F7J4_9BURK|nr:ATP-binding cassette domain-containing protein [Collimonas arenae]AIY40698.1 Alkanesulfonates ABC transporter ATP-binding protein / Sulfonate ABC transporter [Collimonas arenae]
MQIDPVENAELEAAAQLGAPGACGIGVRVQSVSKAYGGREVLKTLNVDIAAGEFVAIVGRSGCGKSTLLRLIAGLEQTSNGSIGFGAEEPEIRIIFQDSRLLPWKRVLSNVGLGLPRASQASVKALAQVGLEDRAHEWPAVLSGGQRQRVALARALVHEPELLLLDEPLGALDALTRIEMQQLIESLWKARGFTAVLVTHDVQEAIALADRVLLIEDGEITLDERISLPRPRARGNLAFAQLEERILARVLKHPAPGLDSALGDISLQRTVNQVGWAI